MREENYKLNEVATLKRKASVVNVRRTKNRNWHITVDVEVEVRLPDGRLVTAWEEVRLRGRGEHKPRPDPVWLYRKASDIAHTSS